MDISFLDQLYKRIFHSISDMVFIMEVVNDSQFKYVVANEAAIEHANLNGKEFYGKLIEEVLPKEIASELNEHYKKALSSEEYYVFEDFVDKNKKSFYGESKLTVYYDDVECKTYILSITRDVTVRKEYEEKLKKLAYEDFLTGLANRKVFEDKLEKCLNQLNNDTKRKAAVLLLDIDYFKQVNDRYGHGVGDELLIRVAHILQKSVTENDTVARIGGDEFAILLEVERQEEAEEVAQRILGNSKEKLVVGEYEIDLSISIGIALSANKRGKMLKKNADQALYIAKENGRKQYVVYKK
jgi:diguanylate cyclase (GGDEF)-like protein/PAS domain S-box-containing protein